MTEEHGGVMIMAGGTGGHIFPGLAVAAALTRRDIRVSWLGANGGMECQRVPAAGIPLEVVDISGLRGKGALRWLLLPGRLLRAVWQAARIFGRRQPACAVSFGGYAAGPGGIAAWLRGVPLLVHEQNRVPGLTNRVLARVADRVLQAFPGSWPARQAAVTCGNPVRTEVAAIAPPAERFPNRSGPCRLLVTGGSQGARMLNERLPAAIAALPAGLRPALRHQAGKGRAEATLRRYRELAVDAEVEEFIDDIAAAYAWADLVVCRAGALTVSELAAAGLGSVLIPFPYAVDDHQARNAEVLVEAGAAHMLRESDCSVLRLSALLRSLLGDRSALCRMAEAARRQALPDAAERVADLCQEYFAR